MTTQQTVDRKMLHSVVLSAVFAGLIGIGAWLRIDLPLSPVPITLQTLFVLLAGIILPPREAVGSVTLYLSAGIIGLPVFSGGTRGFAVIMGPTGGFLLGFLFGAFTVSVLSRTLKRVPKHSRFLAIFMVDIVALIAGTIVVYSFGYPWIVLNLGWEWRVGLLRAVLPFIPGDILKIIAVTLLASPGRKIITRSA